MKITSWLCSILAIIAASFFLTSTTYACSPTEDAFNYTLEDRINSAPVIVHGTVIGGESRSLGSGYDIITTAEVEAHLYLKGKGATQITIQGFGDGADCLSVIGMHQEAIFLVTPIGDSTTHFEAHYLAVHDATLSLDEDKIDMIVSITGEQNQPIPLPLINRVMATVLHWLPIGLLLAGIGIAVWWFVMRRRDGRKPKPKRH